MANTLVQPYLLFGGRCEEALAFYGTALGAKVEMLMHYKDSPEPFPPDMLKPGYESKVMHASFRIGESVLMASDGCGDTPSFVGISLAITVPTEGEADQVFAVLGEGGTVSMPLGKTFWSPKFGMITDRFGVDWMVSVAP